MDVNWIRMGDSIAMNTEAKKNLHGRLKKNTCISRNSDKVV